MLHAINAYRNALLVNSTQIATKCQERSGYTKPQKSIFGRVLLTVVELSPILCSTGKTPVFYFQAGLIHQYETGKRGYACS
jgi:hypothetical protein